MKKSNGLTKLSLLCQLFDISKIVLIHNCFLFKKVSLFSLDLNPNYCSYNWREQFQTFFLPHSFVQHIHSSLVIIQLLFELCIIENPYNCFNIEIIEATSKTEWLMNMNNEYLFKQKNTVMAISKSNSVILFSITMFNL